MTNVVLTTNTETEHIIEVPEAVVADWRYQVANADTILGLSDWYLNELAAESTELTTSNNNEVDIPKLRKFIGKDLSRFDDEHEVQRQQRRSQLITGLFYDDEPEEPGQAIRDELTDIIHEARRRKVDLEQALCDAQRMADTETQDWGIDA